MLQINSGKLYPGGVRRTNELRGIFYSNLWFLGRDDNPVVTAAGRLRQVDAVSLPRPIVYEVTEQFEDETGVGALVSHGVQPYLQDFAAVVSFILRVTCMPDVTLCARLLDGKRSLGVMTPPEKLVRRVFDKDVIFLETDVALLQSFTADLIALERKSFLAAMRAIRTFVTGLHRVKDDLELAYTLLVASIESLAQDFDRHKARWSDYEEVKRQRIDKALAPVDQVVAERVRAAILDGEHLALARRFREFTLAHLTDADFQESDRNGALGKLDLQDALREAYSLRSRYVHTLRDLPHLLDADLGYSESMRTGYATYLTIEGLSRIARKVIVAFVRRQPKCDAEIYDYRGERYGLISAEMAPQYSIWRPENLVRGNCRKVLSALLSQLAAFFVSQSPINDLHQVCEKIEQEFSRFRGNDRKACAAIYVLFNCYLPLDKRRSNYEAFHKQFVTALQQPSIEALCLHLIIGTVPSWSADNQRATLDGYFAKRNQKGGLRVPELFEAGMLLSLAERYRISAESGEARALLSFAAVNAVHYPALVTLHAQFSQDLPIDWRILLPTVAPPETGGEGTADDSTTGLAGPGGEG